MNKADLTEALAVKEGLQEKEAYTIVNLIFMVSPIRSRRVEELKSGVLGASP